MKAARRWVVPLVAGGAALAVYAATLAPSLTWAHWGADGGDFVAAATASRMPHPPGFPMYMALARLVVMLPGGDPAWRLNALSALMAAGAVALTALALQLRRYSTWSVLASALTLALAPLFWSQALIAEVYTTAAFFVALVMFFEARGDRQGKEEPFATGLAWGLATSVHATLVLLAPVWLVRPARWRKDGRGVLPALRLLVGFGVGLLPYALLPLLGAWPQPWGDMRSLAGWWDVVTARIYRGYVFGVLPDDVLPRLLRWAALLARQFTPLGAVLALWGARVRWRQARWSFVARGVVWVLVVAFAFGYGTPDSHVYLVPLLPLVVSLLAEGLASLTERGVPGWVGLVLPLILLAWNWGALDVHRDYEATDWLARTLDATPQAAVLVTMQDDGDLFALWYAQEALGLRRDVLVIDRDLWWQHSYRQYLFEREGRVVAEPEDFAAGRGPLCRIEGEEVVCP